MDSGLRALDGVLGLRGHPVTIRSGYAIIDTNADAADLTLTEDTTLVFSGPTQGQYHEIRLVIRQDATGARALTWPSTLTWVNGATPTLPSTPSAPATIATLVTTDGGASWVGFAGLDTVRPVEETTRGTSDTLASTYDRSLYTETNNGSLASGRLNLYRIMLPKGLPVNAIVFWSKTTAGASMTNQWFAFFDSSYNKLAVTADDGAAAWAANAKKQLAVAGGPVITGYEGWYYLGIVIVGTTPPSLLSPTATVGASAQIAAPIPAGISDTGLTNPASCPATATAPWAGTTVSFAEVA